MYLDFRPLSERGYQCKECWLKTLNAWLCLGWDVHSHACSEPCSAACFTRGPGRSYQASVMRAACRDAGQVSRLTKFIDGAPREFGTMAIQGLRIVRFLGQEPQVWYEPVRSVDELVAHLQLAAKLERSGVPLQARPYLMVVLQLFKSAHYSTTGEIQPPSPGEEKLLLHLVVALRLSEDGRAVEFRNSWGTRWGRHGNGSVSIDYLNQYFCEAWCAWHARWGLNWWKEELRQLPGPTRLRQVWMVQNPLFTHRVDTGSRGDSWYGESFYSYSLCDDSCIEVVQLRNGYGLRMGWTFLCHLRDTSISEIRELFVMPAFRGQGVGYCLEHVACRRARAAQSTILKAVIHQADGGILANRVAVRGFLKSRGYRMRWRNQTGPVAVGYATKDVPQ
jgi:GNAT superfamily N-acetyltransferase